MQPNEKVFQLKSFLDDVYDNSKDVENEFQMNCPGIYFAVPSEPVRVE